MATLLPIPIADRAIGIEEVRQHALHFLNIRKMNLSGLPITKDSSRQAIGEIWDGLGSLDFRGLVTGPLNTALTDEFLALIVTAVLKVQLSQYTATLPAIKPPNIGKDA